MYLWLFCFLSSTVEAVVKFVSLLLVRVIDGGGVGLSAHPKPIVKPIAIVVKNLLVLNLCMGWSMI